MIVYYLSWITLHWYQLSQLISKSCNHSNPKKPCIDPLSILNYDLYLTFQNPGTHYRHTADTLPRSQKTMFLIYTKGPIFPQNQQKLPSVESLLIFSIHLITNPILSLQSLIFQLRSKPFTMISAPIILRPFVLLEHHHNGSCPYLLIVHPLSALVNSAKLPVLSLMTFPNDISFGQSYLISHSYL